MWWRLSHQQVKARIFLQDAVLWCYQRKQSSATPTHAKIAFSSVLTRKAKASCDQERQESWLIFIPIPRSQTFGCPGQASDLASNEIFVRGDLSERNYKTINRDIWGGLEHKSIFNEHYQWLFSLQLLLKSLPSNKASVQNHHHGGFLFPARPGKALVPSLFAFSPLQAIATGKQDKNITKNETSHVKARSSQTYQQIWMCLDWLLTNQTTKQGKSHTNHTSNFCFARILPTSAPERSFTWLLYLLPQSFPSEGKTLSFLSEVWDSALLVTPSFALLTS